MVILSTADFTSAVWTNKQHLAVGLARSRRVVYIESLGLRRPRLSPSDLRRAWARLTRSRDSPVAGREAPPDLTVVSPHVIPFHRSRLVRAINRRLLRRQVLRRVPDAGSAILWTFSPLDYGLGALFHRTVYHCVDLLHEVPRVPRQLVLSSEADLCARADVLIASSTSVCAHLARQHHRSPVLWENVAHTDTFSAPAHPPRRGNRAVFAGNLTPSKVDFALLHEIVDRGIPLELAGPSHTDGTSADRELRALLDEPLVTHHGNLDLAALAQLFAGCTVGLIPYELNGYTQGVFPMKVYEYLSAGLTVVSTALPALADSQIEGVHLATTSHFTDAVERALAAWTEAQAAANVASAAPHSWTRRVAEAEELLDALSSRPRERAA
ncbi:glycosyltransferase [Demequina globuliformis]|uniref:glycosyltransferase n=1 Tax=Demequina globuliformis TaxID=676202 RepID=UPI0013791707|nr:glycosyltransferase [Demequina globuliformis]